MCVVKFRDVGGQAKGTFLLLTASNLASENTNCDAPPLSLVDLCRSAMYGSTEQVASVDEFKHRIIAAVITVIPKTFWVKLHLIELFPQCLKVM
jgi:hypothetical protein